MSGLRSENGFSGTPRYYRMTTYKVQLQCVTTRLMLQLAMLPFTLQCDQVVLDRLQCTSLPALKPY